MDRMAERYVSRVLWNVYLKPEYKRQIEGDLRAHIEEASQQKSVAEVLKDMGHPRKIAAEIMETYRDSYEKMGLWNALMYASRVRDFEVKSETKIGNWPLVHIAMGYKETGEKNIARGVFAFGDIAIGGMAVGAISFGVLALGAVAIGGIAFGAIALGLFLALGSATASLMLAVGAIAISGVFAFGAVAISWFAAIGAFARATYYIDSSGASKVVLGWMEWFTTDLAERLPTIIDLAERLPAIIAVCVIVTFLIFLPVSSALRRKGGRAKDE